MNKEDLNLPQANMKDVAHIGITTFLSSIPGLAGAGELFKFISSPSLDKRRERWMESVRNSLLELDQRTGLTIGSLQNNEEFVSLLILTTQAAQKTHLEEKQELLKNILINSLTVDSDFDLKSVIVGIVERLTPTHIAVFRFIFRNDDKPIPDGFKNYLDYISHSLPGQMKAYDLEVFINDLKQVGLLIDWPNRLPENSRSFRVRIPTFAYKFWGYIQQV